MIARSAMNPNILRGDMGPESEGPFPLLDWGSEDGTSVGGGLLPPV